AVVPDDEIADSPVLYPDKPFVDRMDPQGVEQLLGFLLGQVHHRRVGPAAEIEAAPAGFRMDPHDGMRHRGTLLEPSLAGAVETRIVQYHSPLDTPLQFLR